MTRTTAAERIRGAVGVQPGPSFVSRPYPRATMLPRKLFCLAEAWRRQWWPAEKMRRFAERRLRRMVSHCASHSPYYRRTLAEQGVDPGSLRRLEDLPRLPVTEKEALLAEGGARFRAAGVGASRSLWTSGSGGQPLEVPVDGPAFDEWDAVYARALFAVGYRPWDRIAYFWPSRGEDQIYERLGLMRKRFVSPTADPEEQWERLRQIRPRVIYCFPSTLSLLAGFALDERGPSRRVAPELIVAHGEWLAPTTRTLVEEAFGCCVLDQYGAQEFNRMAWECPEHRRKHVDLDSVVLEVVDREDRPAEPGQIGALLVTGLVNRALPLLRYRIGDFGALSPDPCPCGRSLPVLASLEGRADSFLVRADGSRVSPRQVVPLVETCRFLRQFTVLQERLADCGEMEKLSD